MMPRKPELQNFLLEQYRRFASALRFLSTLPVPASAFLDRQAVVEPSPLLGAEYFPLVGLVLACLLWLFIWLCTPLLPHLVLAALSVIILVLLTGGLHLDGLMDSCDGLFGGMTRERKLEIMRDSRVGSFGVLAGAGALLIKFACFASLSLHTLPLVLLTILPASRWSLVLALNLFPAARESGLGANLRRTINRRTIILACACSCMCALIGTGLAGVMVWCVMTLVTLLLGNWITGKLGGLTGDTYGALAEGAEIAGLLACFFLHIV